MPLLLGDFSTIANDSRFVGPVDEKDIIGLAGLRYWPVSRIETPKSNEMATFSAIGAIPVAMHQIATNRSGQTILVASPRCS